MARSRRRFIRWIARGLAALALVVTFLVATLWSVTVQVNLPVGRRLVAREVSRLVSGILVGKLEVAPFEQISLRGVHVHIDNATVYDVQGRPVLSISDAHADLDLLPFLKNLFEKGTPLNVTIRRIRARRGESAIVLDEATGKPTIEGAFAERPTPPSPVPGRKVSVLMPDIEVRSARLRVPLPDGPELEADVREVHGELNITPSGITVHVAPFGATIRGLGPEARGTATFHVVPPGAIDATFAGLLEQVELNGRVHVAGPRMELSADVPGASPEAVRHLVPDWPLVEQMTAHLEASGDLPDLRARARFTVGRTAGTAEGPVSLGANLRTALQFSVKHFDLRVLSPGAPATDFAVDGDLAAGSKHGQLSASIRARTRESEVDGYPVPVIDAEATLREGAISGLFAIEEPGLPTHGTFGVGRGGAIDVDADARAVDLRKVRLLSGRGVTGSGSAHLRARVANGNLTASLDATTGLVEIASVSVADARVSIQAGGSLDAPKALLATAHVTAAAVKRGAMSFTGLDVHARGSSSLATFDARVRKENGPEVAASGTLAILGHPLLRDTKISLKRDPVLLEGEIAEFDAESATLDVRNIRATGAGGPLTGRARVRPNLVEIEAEGENLDLDALATALGLSRGTLGGRARVSVSLEAGTSVTRGHVRIGARNIEAGTVSGVSAQFFADLDGERFTGGTSGIAEGLGAFGASWDVTLSGSPFELASFRQATGTAELQLSDAELRRLDYFLPKDGPVEKVEGRGYARIALSRPSPLAVLPNLQVTTRTRDLEVALRGSEGQAGTRVRGMDLDATAKFDGEGGATSGAALLVGSHGELASFEGSLKIDLPRLVHDPEHAFSQLRETPFDARANVPLQPIQALPELLRPTGVGGQVGGELRVQGTFARPTLYARFDGRSLVVRHSRLPADLLLEAQYDSASTDLSGRAEAVVAKQPVATATIEGKLPLGTPSGFDGDVRLDVKELSLDLLSAVSKSDLRGRISGTASSATHDGKTTLAADLRIAGTVVGGAPLGDGAVRVATEGELVNASVSFSGARGSFDARGSAGLTWHGLVPSVSLTTEVRGQVVAKDFSAAAMSPLVASAVSRVGGRIDANVTAALTPTVSSSHGVDWTGKVDGSVSLRQGEILIDALGVDLRDVTMRGQVEGKGKATHVSVADLAASIRSKTPNVHGSADFDFEGTSLARGAASIDVKDMPLLIQGAPQGLVNGNAAVHLEQEPERTLVNVDIPTMTLKLPESSSRKVIVVADHPEVAIVQHEEPVSHGASALPWRIRVELGRDVALRRSDIEVKVTGTPVIDLGPETQVTGSIELVPGGRLPVLGQVFIIDRGIVKFDTGVPENPHLNVSAEWRAPRNVVFVQVTGTVKDPLIALRSEPPLPEREIFALIFGGSSDDPSSAERPRGEDSSAARNVALQGGAHELNRLMGQSPVEFRVGSTSTANPRYTAAVRIRENLWFEASTYRESQDTGSPTADQTVVSGTIDYRFSRKWSLRTEAGSSGGAVDLLWQQRY